MKRVLIVDDASFMRMSLKITLEKNGFEVVGEADNGLDGLKKYQELRPDVVTMDITMEGISGIDALKQIKEFDPQAKVVIVSAMGQEEKVKQAIAAGAKLFIVKPFVEEHFIKMLTKLTT